MVRKIAILLGAVMGLHFIATAQNLTVSGSVTDQGGYPLEGATVLVKGTANGTVTDAEGNYRISASGDSELIVSYLGYLSQVKSVNGGTKVDFVLQEDSNFLDDVLVIAYGSMSESDFTGSATQIKGEEIAKASKESIDKGMMGKIAGVRISSDNGDPGSAGSVQIRGVGSISAGTSPLYVIDGVVISSDTQNDIQVGYKSTGILNTINPDDIASITVLKDAAAASLYGSRAANGVILITTKRGRQGKTRVSYSAEAGASMMAVGKALRMMDGPQFIRYIRDAADNAYALNPAYSYGYDGNVWAS